jgi:hypothetical protein
MNTPFNQFEDNLGELINLLKLANDSSDDDEKQRAMSAADFFFDRIKDDVSGTKTFIPAKSTSINESKLDKVINNYKRLF